LPLDELVTFSIVMPIHNEEKFLPYSLPSIFNLKPDEVILIFDRCTDRSIKIAKKISERFLKRFRSKIMKIEMVEVNEKSRWRMHLNFLYDLGIRKSKSKVVLLSQADIVYDYLKIRENIKRALYGMVSFSVTEHPHISPWNHFVTVTLQRLGVAIGFQRFSGLIAFSKEHYLTCPLTCDDQLNFDTQLLINFNMKEYPYIYVMSKNFNLRPMLVFRGEREKLLKVGVDRYKMGKPFWNVLLLSIIRLTPEVLSGYIHAKLV